MFLILKNFVEGIEQLKNCVVKHLLKNVFN